MIYAASDISYTAGFCFDWDNNDGFRYSKLNNDLWTLKVPKKYEYLLSQKCSMYVLDATDFIPIPKISTPEYYSIQPAKVIKEIKFNTCWDCLNKYKVKVILK